MKKIKLSQNSSRREIGKYTESFTKRKERFQPIFNIEQYRMIYSSSYSSSQLEYISHTCNSTEIMKLLFQLASYYCFNRNLPFYHLVEMIDLTLLDIPCSNDQFQILFQNLERFLRAIIIHHYSFSYPIPLYFPIIKQYSKMEIVKCKEFRNSLTLHNPVVSFGIRNAAINQIGKSTVIIIELNFEPSSISSCGHHDGLFDLRLAKNFFPGVTCDPYHTNWEFFDVNSPTDLETVKLMLKYVDIVIVHILEMEFIKNFTYIDNTLKSINLNGKRIFIFIREILNEEKTKKCLDEHIYTVIQNSVVTKRTNNELNYQFLGFYPTFIKLMIGDVERVEEPNMQSNKCFNELNYTKMCFVVNDIIQKMVSGEESVLILWKFAQDQQILTNEFSIKGPLTEHANDKYSNGMLRREAILSPKYFHRNNLGTCNLYNESLSTSKSCLIKTGESFELINGDSLVFSGKELNSMFRCFHVRQTEFIQKYNADNPENQITEAPLVLSIIGPQSSGKSTLLNNLFGCKFPTSMGRYTRGVYGSLLELNKPINKSKFLLVLDTEGIDSVNVERSSEIHFDRTLILFCLSVSNVVIINLTDEFNNEMQELTKICAYSLNHLKVHRTTMPKLIFILNQIADPNLENRRTDLKLLINNLDKGIDAGKKSDRISDLIQLTEDNLFTLPPGFDIDMAMARVHIEEIFNKGVIKPSPTLNFALKCLLLRVSIFKKLEVSEIGERPSFSSMIEWLDMAGKTWKTIIKYQDVIQFRNLNEIHLHRKLKTIVDKLVTEYFYTKRKEFYKIVEEYSSEISKFNSLSASELMGHIDRKIQKFEDTFNDHRIKCIREFDEVFKNLQNYRPLRLEHLERLKKLIAMQKLDYIIFIKTRTDKIYHQIKGKECVQNFKKTVTNNISGFATMEIKAQDEAFEKLWKESFKEDDLEKSYREQILADFYLIFTRECDLIPYQELFKIYKRNGFKLEAVERTLRTNVVENLTKNRQNEEPYFFPTKKSLPLKDIESHLYANKLEYLNEEYFYHVHSTEGQESNFVRYHNSQEIFKRDWVPEDCVPLLQSCSGYYPEQEINWKELSPREQITKLVTCLIRSKLYFSHSIPKLVLDIIHDTAVYNDHDITPVTIQQIAGALDKRLTIFNHEISHIGAELTIHARRSISTFVFSKAFTSFYTRKWQRYSKNRKEITTEKASLKQYLLNKVEISKVIHSNTEGVSSVKYDDEIAQKYVKTFMTSLNASMTQELSKRIHKQLRTEKEMFEYENITLEAEEKVTQALSSGEPEESICDENITLEAEENVSQALSSGEPEESICDENITLEAEENVSQALSSGEPEESICDENITLEAEENVSQALSSGEPEESDENFVVKYICQRNDALEEIFDSRWENFIETNCSNIISEIVENTQNEITLISEQLTNILHYLDIEDKSLLNSEKCFKPCKKQPKDCDEFQLNESPYRSMLLYLKYVMNPEYTQKKVLKLFGKKFECNNTKMKFKSDLLKENNVLGCFDLGKVFDVLERAEFFETELIFNLHSFLSSFNKSLEESEITISNNQLLQIISTYKHSMIKDSLGCTRQCPCCGKFCDTINHENMLCSSSNHQFASMGGNTWANDKQHSAILMRCEDYTDEMTVTLPGRLIKWREFKRSTERAWDWEDNRIFHSESYERKARRIKIWDKFGKGILEFQRVHKGANIAFRPYEEDLMSESDITKYQLCFVVDGTGSIGRNIENVRDSIQHLVNSYKRTKKVIMFRVIIYRDHCDDELIDTYPTGNRFLSSDKCIVKFLNSVIPGGGGDIPEASLDGLAIALNSNWEKGDQTRRMIIHLFDAPPHGNFPDYATHNTNSNPDHCCCCSGKCDYNWQDHVWKKMKELEVEYHGINTGDSHWVEFENTMKRELDYLCKGFTKCAKKLSNDAVIQTFINYQCEQEDDYKHDGYQMSSDRNLPNMFQTMSWN